MNQRHLHHVWIHDASDWKVVRYFTFIYCYLPTSCHPRLYIYNNSCGSFYEVKLKVVESDVK